MISKMTLSASKKLQLNKSDQWMKIKNFQKTEGNRFFNFFLNPLTINNSIIK
jgi:hypothetical protein